MKNNLRIKFYCRSFDLRLYEKSKAFYASLGYPCVRLTDQTADGYFYTMLADTDCDIAINVDEDCFIADPEAVFRLVDYVVEYGYVNAACPEGGGATPRNANPIVTNPFFDIFDLRQIRQKAGDALAIAAAVKAFDYRSHLQEMIDAYPKESLQKPGRFELTDTEPYYPFFFWLAYHFKTLYLPSRKHSDGWTTMLYDLDGNLLCQHSWLSRFYSTPDFLVRYWQKGAGQQKQRIDALIAETAAMRGLAIAEETAFDTRRYALDKMVRWIIKVPQRVAGWPQKIRRRLHA